MDESSQLCEPRHDGLWRSIDRAATWMRIDDEPHRFGGVNALAADLRVFGRVYIGTSGRGIVGASITTSETMKNTVA